MQEPTLAQLGAYLSSLLGKPVQCRSFRVLGHAAPDASGKTIGYGVPLLIEYESDRALHKATLHTMPPGRFGHEHMADRAAILLWSHDAFNTLPRHVRSLDVGGFDHTGYMISLGQVREFFLLTEYAEGREYAADLERLRDGGALTPLDLERADAICDYLLNIHRRSCDQPGLYVRRIRELIGHGECIMGLIDSYPLDHDVIPRERLERIEHLAVGWRWRLKPRTHRLRQVHGDFHPWNILFANGTEFRLLDRSRGAWGEPADDIACLTLNYVFEALQGRGRVEGPLAELFERFWSRYLDRSGDSELLEVVPPFIAFRGLVMASPAWYPDLSKRTREKLFSLIENVLSADRFDPARMNEYLETVARGS